jgi:hypothetical protein
LKYISQNWLLAFTAIFVTLLTFEVCAGDLLPSFRARSVSEDLSRPEWVPSDDELELADAVIGEVVFDVQDIFAVDTPDENTSLFRLANYLHIETKPSVIAQQILFQSGEKYSRQKMEETERLLRSRKYLLNVRVYPFAYHDGRVDVRVSTREVWTLHPGVSFGRSGGSNSTGAVIEELNLFGYGKQLGVNYKSNVDRTTTVYDYQDPQLFGSRWTLAAQVGNNSDGRKEFLAIDRPFYSLDTRWSAGVRMVDDQRIDSIYDLGAVRDQYDVRQRGATLYAGLSDGLQGNYVSRWTAGMVYDDKQYAARLSATSSGFAPTSSKLVYPWMGYELIENQYRKLENLNQIGRAEDVSLGWRGSAFVGFASPGLGADRKALVWSGTFRHGAAPRDNEIAELNATVSGRVENGQLVNTMTNVAGKYYWRQSPRQLFFINLQADIGSRLDDDQRLTLGGDNGLRGYPLRYQNGSGRWNMTAEQRLFSDWYPFRLMRVGGAIFYDMGRTWGDNPVGSRSVGVLRDAGFGLRIAHSRSGFGNMTHIDIAFPLGANKDISKAQLLIETKRSF